MARKTIDELIADRDYPDDVAAAVKADAELLGTVKKIEKGELVLPSASDAVTWHERMKREAEQRRRDAQ